MSNLTDEVKRAAHSGWFNPSIPAKEFEKLVQLERMRISREQDCRVKLYNQWCRFWVEPRTLRGKLAHGESPRGYETMKGRLTFTTSTESLFPHLEYDLFGAHWSPSEAVQAVVAGRYQTFRQRGGLNGDCQTLICPQVSNTQ